MRACNPITIVLEWFVHNTYSLGTVIAGLSVVAFFGSGFIILIGLCGYAIAKAVENARLARKYHELQNQPAPSMPTGGYTLVYKEGRATKTAFVQGTTEAEALLSATRQLNIRYDRIVSLTKN